METPHFLLTFSHHAPAFALREARHVDARDGCEPQSNKQSNNQAGVRLGTLLSACRLRPSVTIHKHRSSSFGCCRLLSACGLGTCWCSPNLSQSLPGHALPSGLPKSCSPSTSLLTFLQALCLSLFPECQINRQPLQQTNHFITAVSRFRSEPSDVAKLNSFPDLTLTTRPRKRLQLLQSPPQNPQQLSIHYNVRGADRGKP